MGAIAATHELRNVLTKNCWFSWFKVHSLVSNCLRAHGILSFFIFGMYSLVDLVDIPFTRCFYYYMYDSLLMILFKLRTDGTSLCQNSSISFYLLFLNIFFIVLSRGIFSGLCYKFIVSVLVILFHFLHFILHIIFPSYRILLLRKIKLSYIYR